MPYENNLSARKTLLGLKKPHYIVLVNKRMNNQWFVELWTSTVNLTTN